MSRSSALPRIPGSAGALTVPGRSVHASARLEGVDAVQKYLLVHAALRRLEARRNRDAAPLMARYRLPYPVSVGTVRAGDWVSCLPEALVAEGRLGVALGEPVAQARAELEAAVAQACAEDDWLAANPVQVAWWGGQFAPGQVDETAPVARLVSDSHLRLHGAPPAVHGVPYGSDQRLLTGLGGVPAVLYGPGDVRQAHGPDESVGVDEMVSVTRTLVLLLATACGTR